MHALSSAPRALAILFCALTATVTTARADDNGRAVEGREFKSALLGRNIRYSVYLPRGYEFESTRHYPVVYLLHGDPKQSVYTESDWIQRGAADRFAGAAIHDGKIPPVILIMPEAAPSGYVSGTEAKVRREDMLVQEFVPYVDRTFRTRTQPLFRSIVGLSVAGRDALLLALRHPELFGSAAALSPAIQSDEALLNLARTLPAEQIRRIRFWIDIGDDDPFSEGSDALHTVLRQRQIPHEYRVRDGSHEWTYWRAGLVDALEFAARAYW